MRVCPSCHKKYNDARYCPEDGTATISQAINATSTPEHPTQALRPPITMLTLKRTEDMQTTQPVSLENFQLSVRLGVEADHEENPRQANEKRCAAALRIAQTIHEALLRRLQRAAILSNRTRWSALLPKRSKELGPKKLDAYLKKNEPPSLSAIGGWFSQKYRLQPEELTVELQTRLGVPTDIGDELLIAGDVRNILAHRSEYEVNARMDLELASERLQVSSDGTSRKIIVPVSTLDWLEILCRKILEKSSGGLLAAVQAPSASEMLCLECMRTYPPGSQRCSVDGKDLYPTKDDPLIGRTIESFYRIERSLGYGGMGRVYYAKRLSDGQPFALKFLRKDLAQKPEMVRRFQREAKASTLINHPNCARILGSGQTRSGLFYLAMEYLDGYDLSALIQQGPMNFLRAANIVRQICAGLTAIHSQKIIHRDIKPTNIMLITQGGARDFVKILDFGIAKMLHPEMNASTTGLDVVYGTPAYMSPEQARGDALDARSDLYSLGVLLFQMTTGRLPFTSTEPMQLLVSHAQSIPPSPRVLRPDIPNALEYIILHALEKNRENRFKSAEEMEKELSVFCRA